MFHQRLHNLTNKIFRNDCGAEFVGKKIIDMYSGPKTNFLPPLPMAGDVIKFTSQIFFFPAMKLFLQKQAVITTTMTKHIYNVFNLSCYWCLY